MKPSDTYVADIELRLVQALALGVGLTPFSAGWPRLGPEGEWVGFAAPAALSTRWSTYIWGYVESFYESEVEPHRAAESILRLIRAHGDDQAPKGGVGSLRTVETTARCPRCACKGTCAWHEEGTIDPDALPCPDCRCRWCGPHVLGVPVFDLELTARAAALCVKVDLALARRCTGLVFRNASGWVGPSERLMVEPFADVLPKILDWMSRYWNDARFWEGERVARALLWICALAEHEGVVIACPVREVDDGG